MKHSILRAVFGMIVILALGLQGCSSLDAIFATATPTPSATPTITPSATPTATFTPTITPTATFTPTATPLPPVKISGCLNADDCPDAKLITRFFPEDSTRSYNIEYPVTIPYDANVRFYSGWCAIDGATLDENMDHIQFVFTIDDVSYVDDLKRDHISNEDENDPNVIHPCFAVGGVLSGWKLSQSHLVTIGVKITDKIFDGWDTYLAGTPQLRTYRINPAFIPTVTFTPTITQTPTRAPTRVAPTFIPVTATPPAPACDNMGSIHVTNNTGGWMTVTLNGPAQYSFSFLQKDNDLSVCKGEYKYTAYGCSGGSSISGNISTGGSLEFSCRSK
jgi:hypothetical protein